MDLVDIAHQRLISQQIVEPRYSAVKDIVGWMGAMQAQDYAMMKWAVGVRLLDATDQTIETAINKGEVIRTHLLRPTWHLVSADDVRWLLELTAPQIKATLKSRHRGLGLSESVVARSNEIVAKAVEEKPLTRRELIIELEKAGFSTADNRASHLLLRAELAGIVCSGATKEGEQTYALLEERVPKTTSLSREEALAALAKKYFTSHAPATVQDFVWWSGLSVSDAKRALAMVKSDFASETIAAQRYWFPNLPGFPKPSQKSVHLLPAYDEFLISYKDRTASFPAEDFHKAVSNNGIFRPVIVINGQVTGIWRRASKKDKVVVETELFDQTGKTTKSLIEAAATQYGRFLGKEIEIRQGD